MKGGRTYAWNRGKVRWANKVGRKTAKTRKEQERSRQGGQREKRMSKEISPASIFSKMRQNELIF